DAAVSDAGLVTNTVVGYGVVPLSSTGVEAPAGGAENHRNFGDLPPVLKDSSGQPLARLGQRFVSLTVPWLQTQADAGRYAATVRQLGLAAADQAEVTTVLRGDIPIGTTVTLSGQGKRYYVVTTEPLFRYGDQQQTRLTLRYGLGIGDTWNVASLSNYGNLTLPGYQDSSTLDGTTQPASLPPLALDPSILLTDPTLTKDDIYRIMTMPPGCAFASQATYIWQESQTYGIDPSFALAVWMIETRLGTDGSTGSQQNNPGNLGPLIPFASWQAGIDAWFIFIKKLVGRGQTTIQTAAPSYIPDTTANPHQMEDWIRNVSGQMESYRGKHRVAAIPTALPAAGAGGAAPVVPADGSQPRGYPFAAGVLYPVTQTYGPKSGGGEPAYGSSPHFHYGIDLGCGSGTVLFATIGGVLKAGPNNPYQDASGNYGFLVTITNGPFIPFASWQAGIDAWYQFIKKLIGQGMATIQAVAPSYIPDTAANPHQMEDWIRNVSGQMESYRGKHRVAAIPTALPAAGAGG
ncbi:MAG TPA: hypothetical protein VGP33_00610, partial [Chloroflexota bacterium]|nr:hypothetical protein [Chloroflexota bacterium]